jgi:hypothetical protein
MGGVRSAFWLLTAASWLTVAAPAQAELRLSDLAVYLNDHEVTVHVVAVGALPPTFYEPIQSGIPAHVRLTAELWQYQWGWRDRLLTTRIVERNLTYNVVTQEYRVTFLKGESHPVYATRDLRDAQRVLSEVRAVKLSPASNLEPDAVIYVRVRAEAALNGENTFLTRLAGAAEHAMLQSEYRTLRRVQ